MQHLSGPHAVGLKEVVEDEGRFHIIMEMCPMGDLLEQVGPWIGQGGDVPIGTSGRGDKEAMFSWAPGAEGQS